MYKRYGSQVGFALLPDFCLFWLLFDLLCPFFNLIGHHPVNPCAHIGNVLYIDIAEHLLVVTAALRRCPGAYDLRHLLEGSETLRQGPVKELREAL